MTISPDLFLAILSMDAYNRGYSPGIDGLSDAPNTEIGSASIREVDLPPGSVSAGFYAIAYNTPYGQVIFYRGTDDDSLLTLDGSDIWHGWTFGAGFGTSQIDLAQACPHAFH